MPCLSHDIQYTVVPRAQIGLTDTNHSDSLIKTSISINILGGLKCICTCVSSVCFIAMSVDYYFA